MERSLTNYLFRSTHCKPAGRRLKLDIISVNKKLCTFDEQQHPAATIMTHGLFLAQATPNGVKNPLLLSVLNQTDLCDYEPPTQLGVFWASQQMEGTITGVSRTKERAQNEADFIRDHPYIGAKATWMAQSIAFIKHRIIKTIPHNGEVDCHLQSFLPFMTGDESDRSFVSQSIPFTMNSWINWDVQPEAVTKPSILQTPNGVFPIDPTHLFLSFIQVLLDSRKAQLSKMVLELQEPKIQASSPNLAPLSMFGGMLCGMYSSLCFYKQLLPPSTEPELAVYGGAIEQSQACLVSLSSLFLELLLDPLFDTIARASVCGDQSILEALPQDLDPLKKVRCSLERLIRVGQTAFDQLEESVLQESSQTALLCQEEFVNLMLECLKIPKLSGQFFAVVRSKLETYPIESRNVQNVNEYLVIEPDYANSNPFLFHAAYMSTFFQRVGNELLQWFPNFKICLTRSAKESNRNFFCKAQPNKQLDWKIIAIFYFQETKICFAIEAKSSEEKQASISEGDSDSGSNIVTRVFRDDQLVACFSSKPHAAIMSRKCEMRTLEHFTGRYFVRFLDFDELDDCSILVVDLAPCIEETPQAPAIYTEALETFLGVDEPMPFVYALTDRFLSFMTTSDTDIHQNGAKTGRPVSLQLITFDSPHGFTRLPPVSCAQVFDQLTQHVSRDKVYEYESTDYRLCWSKNLRTLYYTHWKWQVKAQEPTTLLIGCFGVSDALDSLTVTAFSCYHLNHLMQPELFAEKQPKFSTLRTKEKEYLVMDIVHEFETDYEVERQSPTIFGRAHFVVHNRRLHWVPVNGQLVYKFSTHIGNQMKYPGYETSCMSLFHHRRVFCTDKIISAVHRLRYSMYGLRNERYALHHSEDYGPVFGYNDLGVWGDYRDGGRPGIGGFSRITSYDTAGVEQPKTELMGSLYLPRIIDLLFMCGFYPSVDPIVDRQIYTTEREDIELGLGNRFLRNCLVARPIC